MAVAVPTIVGSTPVATGTTASGSVVLPDGAAVGEVLVAHWGAAWVTGSGVFVGAVSDPKGNVWTQRYESQRGATCWRSVWTCTVATALASGDAVSWTSPGGKGWRVQVTRVAGAVEQGCSVVNYTGSQPAGADQRFSVASQGRPYAMLWMSQGNGTASPPSSYYDTSTGLVTANGHSAMGYVLSEGAADTAGCVWTAASGSYRNTGGVVLLAAPTYAEEVAADAPDAWYGLDEENGPAVDKTGNHTLTSQPSAVARVDSLVPGSPGRAWSLPGSGRNGSPLSASGMLGGRPEFSIEAWIVHEGTNNTTPIYAEAQSNQSTGALLMLSMSSRSCTVYYRNTSANQMQLAAPAESLPANALHHIVVAKRMRDDGTGTHVDLYIDGVRVATGEHAQGLLTAPNNAAVGYIPRSASANPIRAQVDEISLYWKALTPERVAAHYRAGAARAERVRAAGG